MPVLTSNRPRTHRAIPKLAAALAAAIALGGCASQSTVAAEGSTTPGQAGQHRAQHQRVHKTQHRPPAGSATATHPTPSHRQPPAAPVTIAFGGDVHFEGVDGARLAADPSTALGPVAAVLRSADLAMVNLETAVTTGGTPAQKQYVFRAPATAFAALRAAGVDVATMANNHGMDYGLTGLEDSLAAAHAAHFPVVGIGQDAAQAYAPYRVTVGGDRIAIVGATQVIDTQLIADWTAGPGKPGLASAKDLARMVAAVRAARKGADTVIVYLHYGVEMTDCPTADQQAIARALVAAGADIVVGSHAHVLLGGGWLGDAYVDYGLGNFVFYTGGGVTADSGVLELTVRGHEVSRSRWIPAYIEGGVPVPLTGQAATDALADWTALRACTGLSAAPR